MENRIVNVRNRNSGMTCYKLPELGIDRLYTPGEVKKVPFEEIRSLSNAPGGMELLRNFLIVSDVEALEEINIGDIEPEYFYTEEEIKKLLEDGTLDQLEDCLNFAPQGVIDILKQTAVAMQLPDNRKRNLITEKTGFNINNAIMVNEIMDTPDEGQEEEKKVRKAAPVKVEEKAAPARKAVAPKYKVVEPTK